MDFNLTRGLRLHTKPDDENLDSWAINEIDAQGQQIGDDQIPWFASLYFTATSCVLRDSIEINQTEPERLEVALPQVIQVQLRPGIWRNDVDADFYRRMTFSMFGTDRSIQSFGLDIHPIADSAEQESCKAWGSVSYTSETADFRNETTDDCIVFSMYLKPKTFARYAAKIAHGLVDEMIFCVGEAHGFYFEENNSTSTARIKVLTKGSEQNVTLPAGLQFEPPRLGTVGYFAFHIGRVLEFEAAPDAVEETADVGTVRAAPETQAAAAVEPRTLQMLGSLRRAAWLVVILLALIFIATLLQR